MNIAIILAAGSSHRFNADAPKQFYEIEGKPLIWYAINSFHQAKAIDLIVLVSKKDHIDYLSKLVQDNNFTKVKHIILGGSTRQESSFNGVKFLKTLANDDDIVLIHDAARPLVSERVINECIEGAKKHNAVTTVLPSDDTTAISSDGERIGFMPDRKTIYRVQTPQAFKVGMIYIAHHLLKENVDNTDDAGLIFKTFMPVHLVMGEKRTMKVTSLEDVYYLQSIIHGEKH
ncbi:MAG: 2-C-methyl-D-erythritol 4-phosphate cytidylyltransferase [Bacilli bacterium]|jgi:2-C-methyl-D-erythritol 4-phosphate cytidylyltransferase